MTADPKLERDDMLGAFERLGDIAIALCEHRCFARHAVIEALPPGAVPLSANVQQMNERDAEHDEEQQ